MRAKKRRKRHATTYPRVGAGTRRPRPAGEGEMSPLLGERLTHHETSPALSGGDLDADWQRALSSGEEAVGGSVATPDQDVVDEIGHALGVEQAPDAELHTSSELLTARDRHYWHLERKAAEQDEES